MSKDKLSKTVSFRVREDVHEAISAMPKFRRLILNEAVRALLEHEIKSPQPDQP